MSDDHTDNGHADDGHGHGPMFDYQPALPISNGKAFMWLFLSTEIMFFAALIGTYIVLRFGALTWPSTHDVHLAEIWGAVNTFVLICFQCDNRAGSRSGEKRTTLHLPRVGCF